MTGPGRQLIAIIAVLSAFNAVAEGVLRFEVPMENRGSSTFYVRSTLQGVGESLWLVDTGSGHSVIRQDTLDRLLDSGDAVFLKNLQGVMADGSTRIVPLYRVSSISLGDGCIIRDIQAAVLPGNQRQILGISALQKAAPFSFSFDPPTLTLGGCATNNLRTSADHGSPPVLTTPQPLNDSSPTEHARSATAG